MNSDAKQPILEMKGVGKRFGPLQVLNDVSTRVMPSEVVVVCGPSGSGKSTLVRTINRLESIDRGRIEFEGKDIQGLHLDKLRAQMGFVFQSFNLFAHLNARDNIAIGLRRVLNWSRDDARARADELLLSVGLAHRADSLPAMLSGGEQQRVAICRAVAMKPKILLLDEPTSALDPEMVGEILSLLKTLAREGSTMVCVTHEIGFAREVADTIWFMSGGYLREAAPSGEFFRSPKHAEAQRFLGAMGSAGGAQTA